MHQKALNNLQTDENFEDITRLNNQSKENSRLIKLIKQKYGMDEYRDDDDLPNLYEGMQENF